MDRNNQNKTRYDPRKQANAGSGITTHPIANAKPSGQNCKSSEMNPSRQLWEFSDRVIPPFLILFVIVYRLALELEDNSFHMAIPMMLNGAASGAPAPDSGKKGPIGRS